MSQGPHIRIELLSNPMYLSGARELVSAVSRRLGFNEANCSQIALAVDEALCNIIRHGYDRQADRPIWLSIWPLEEPSDRSTGCSTGCSLGCSPGSVSGNSVGSAAAIKIVIEDEAKQVEPTCIKGRDLEDVRPGGLGVHIIKEVMDEARYEKREGAGMRLTLVKRQAATVHQTGTNLQPSASAPTAREG